MYGKGAAGKQTHTFIIEKTLHYRAQDQHQAQYKVESFLQRDIFFLIAFVLGSFTDRLSILYYFDFKQSM